jgi:ATP-binding cassette, subfamily B, bacterial
MAKKKRKGTPVVDVDDEVEDVVKEDENDVDDDDDDADDEDDEVSAAVAVGAFRQVTHFFRLYVAPYRTGLLLLALGVVIETAYNTIFPLCLKYLIDEAIGEQDHEVLVWILTIMGGMWVVVSIVTIAYEYQNARLGARLLGDVRRRLFVHLQSLTMGFYERAKVGDVLSRFSIDLGALNEVVMHCISWGILPLLEIAAGTVLLFVLSWPLALTAMLIFPLTFLGPRLLSPRALTFSYRQKQQEGTTLGVVQENITAQPVIRAFSLHEATRGWFDNRNYDLVATSTWAHFLRMLVERSVTLSVMLLHLLILAVGAWLALNGKISIGTLVTFESVFWEISYNIGHFTEFLPVLIEGASAVQHINDLLAEPAHDEEPVDLPALPRLTYDIVFDNVSFSYTGSEQQLCNINCTIPRGAHVAIVGPSGAGKSTTVALLLRLHDPTAGTVKIDGHDVRAYTRDSLRAQMAVVFQDNFLFDLSIRDNIRLGNLTATDADVEAAAKAAEIHRFIQALPDGYDTMVGERGVRLSGGQRQRIAMARALVRNPAILILDEAASALDQATEAAINKTLKKVSQGRTVISVTHRLTSVVDSDIIYVLNHGRLVEQGTHHTLLQRHGLYSKLWQSQGGHQDRSVSIA